MAIKRTAGFLERLTPILLIATIALSFVVGNLWEKVKGLEAGSTKVQGTQAGAQTPSGTQGAGNP